MALREELLDRLKRLSLSQFAEVLFRLSIDVSHLPTPLASQTERAIVLLRLLEQEELGLGRLQKLLKELDWFKHFPEGISPIVQELREHGPERVPFICGRPVRPGEFLNRETELRIVFNRLYNRESTAIVGGPHIGKTSLLLKLADRETQRAYLGDAQPLVFSLLNLHPIGSDYTPAVFWEEALAPLVERPGHAATARSLRQVAQAGYTRRSLERLFNHLGKRGWRLVLLLDEFEKLLSHPNFLDFEFFATLRGLASITESFSFITASRVSVNELNKRGYKLRGSGGSPLFNIQIEERLRPFDEETIGALLDRAGETLSPDDRRFVRRVAGCHPFLLQAMAAALVETTGSDRQSCATERFYQWISFHFDDLWQVLDDRTRATAVVLSLVELGKRALGEAFAFGEIENITTFAPELQKLVERGLAERIGKDWQFDREHLLLCQGERWTIGSQAFAWWVRDVVIIGTRAVPSYDEWLADKRYGFLLTQAQWDWLVDTVRNAPEWAVRGVGGLARALFEELVRRK